MIVTGLTGLLSSNTTREVDLSCGISLVVRKFRFTEWTKREQLIVDARAFNQEIVETTIGMLEKATKNKAIQEKILEALKDSLTEVLTRSNYAYFEEVYEFDQSDYGLAVDIFLIAQESRLTNPPKDVETEKLFGTLEDCFLFAKSLKQGSSDRMEVLHLLSWAKDIDLLKKPDSPEVTEVKTETSSDGDS